MVQKTQRYLNTTYRNNPGYNIIAEDGLTGWATIYALTRALQIELGLPSPANNFGNATVAAFEQRYPNGIEQQSSNSRVHAIIQGALWCKGYSTGTYNITESFDSGMASAIISLKTHAGLENPDSTVTLNVMKGLLSMDQYQIVNSGSSTIQNIQRRLNRRYERFIGIIPCDGLYGREMNKALIIALQVLVGAGPDGIFGNETKEYCPVLPDDIGIRLSYTLAEDAIYLVKYALCCNGYIVSISDAQWDTDLETVLRTFQSDMMLTVTGKADIDTWMSLLISKGNPDRVCTACDTRFEITLSRAAELKSKGYQIVGRYLTGGDFKELREDEPQRILDNGLYFFPIFQEAPALNTILYYTKKNGKTDAEKAVRAARKFRVPEGNVIYFAVDTDATSVQITDYVMPYFAELNNNMDTAYKIGVYGTRNVCTQLYKAGYAEASFVSDMSTGYSGNMGFKISPNWNFDQYAEISMETTVDGSWAIDKDAYSGRFSPVMLLDEYIYEQPAKPVRTDANRVGSLTGMLELIEKLEDLYVAWYTPQYDAAPNVVPYLSAQVLAKGITNFLRSGVYNDIKWKIMLGASDEGFINYVKEKDSELYGNLYNYMIYEQYGGYIVSDGYGGFINLKHMAAVAEGYFTASPAPDKWYGWIGDLVSVIQDAERYVDLNKCSYRQAADKVVGDDEYSLSYVDICADADAIKIAELIQMSSSRTHSFSEALRDYYSNYVDNRILYLLDDIGCKANLTDIRQKIVSHFDIVLAEVAWVIGAKMDAILEGGLSELADLLRQLNNIRESEAGAACCSAFAYYLYCELE